MTWFTYELFLSNFSISFWQCICNSRNVEVVTLVLKILHNHIMVNYFYGNMCTHNQISSNLWYVYCCQLSSFWLECHHLHMDEIVFVLQLVEWMVNFIKYVCAMCELIFAYLLSFLFFHICLYVIFFYGIFHLFHFWNTFCTNFE